MLVLCYSKNENTKCKLRIFSHPRWRLRYLAHRILCCLSSQFPPASRLTLVLRQICLWLLPHSTRLNSGGCSAGALPSHSCGCSPGTLRPRSSGRRSHQDHSSPGLPCRPLAAMPPSYVSFYHERFGTAARHCRPPCSWLALQGCPRPLTAQLAGGHLILLWDSISSRDFLVDSGSSYSLLPHQSLAPPSGPILRTANGAPLPTWGIRNSSVRFGTHVFSFPFLLAPVSLPILGADYLAAHHLHVDAHCRQVLLSSSL